MPDNGIYATLTYIAAAIVYTGYALTIHVRTKRLEERWHADSRRPRSS